jgi:lipoprotein-releasing system permease protein
MKSPILPYLVRRFLFGAKEGSVRSATLLTAASGIFFACALVLVSLGILSGFQRAYKRAVLDFNTHIIVQNYFSEFGLTADDQDLLRDLLNDLSAEFPHTASAYLFEETLMPTHKGLRPVGLKGIEWKKRATLYPYQAKAWEGTSADVPPLFVGADILSLQGGVEETRELKILKLKGPADRYQVGYEKLAVTGIFKSGLYNFDSRYVLMDISDLQRRMSDKATVDGFEIRLVDPDNISAFEKRLRKIMPNTFRLKTWDEINGDLFEALELERRAFIVIAVLILMIASLNILASIFCSFCSANVNFLFYRLWDLPKLSYEGFWRS